MVEKTTKVFYRYDNSLHNSLVTIAEYPVVRETPCGCWIKDWDRERFILLQYGWDFQKKQPYKTKKRFAQPTKKEAATDFMFRKLKQIAILEEQIETAKDALASMEKYSDTSEGSMPDYLPEIIHELEWDFND